MSKKRKSFIVHFDSLNVLDDLTNEQAGLLFKAIKGYQLGDEFELDALTKVAFSPFKNQFLRDAEKYENLCEKNRLIAINRHSTKSTSGTSRNQSLPESTKSTDNDSKSKSDSKNDNDSKVTKDIVAKAPVKRFIAPTVEDVYQYCNERCNNVDAQNFVDHYIANGWVRGKTKVKDWKACVRTWEKNAKPNNQGGKQYSDTTAKNIKNLEGEW